MLAAIQKAVQLPAVRLEGVVSAATGLAFLWLLAKGVIQPLAIFLLQLYLWF